MSEEKHRDEAAPDADHEVGHPFARGLLTGAALGVGVGLLFAPRSGSQMRQEVGHQWSNMKSSCATGYHRVKDTAGDWAERGRRAYGTTREKVVHGAHETRGYVREVSEAVMRKGHREPPSPAARKDLAVAAPREPARAIGPRG
jgi:gas vesicle protein